MKTKIFDIKISIFSKLIVRMFNLENQRRSFDKNNLSPEDTLMSSEIGYHVHGGAFRRVLWVYPRHSSARDSNQEATCWGDMNVKIITQTLVKSRGPQS